MKTRLSAACAAIVVSFCAATAFAELTTVELTFDDQVAGTGVASGHEVVDNLETQKTSFGAGAVTATLFGTAVRTPIDEGRYGRGVDMVGGGGGIELAPWTANADYNYYFWLKARDTTSGTIVAHVNSWDVRFEAGEVVLGAFREDGSYVSSNTGAMWPQDGAFHHLSILMAGQGGGMSVVVAIDHSAVGPVDVPFTPRASAEPVRVAEGFDGLVDEVLIRENPVPPSNNDRFDRDPTWCPMGTECVEEVFVMTPQDFTHEVPVRVKTLYSAACTPQSPCPLIVAISGGNKCSDDYDQAQVVRALADDAGFVVATVDLYCEGDLDWSIVPHELSQVKAAKDFVLTQGAARDRILGTEYFATGCSHGAALNMFWALEESDFPARSYVRSAGGSGFCDFVSGQLCPLVVEAGLERLGVAAIGDVDLEEPAIRAIHERGDYVGRITAEIVGSREITRSWGKNTTGPVCEADGNYACNEDGLWAMGYASRRFRDVWQAHEGDTPSGYFVEDRGADCRHCATVTSPAFQCGMCSLRFGRAGMEQECPQCLSYEGAEIDAGEPAELCELDASWYVDPLAPAGGDDMGGVDAGSPDAGPADAGSDVGSTSDLGGGGGEMGGAGGDGDPPTGLDAPDKGCCAQVGASRTSAAALFGLLLLGLLSRRRQ